MLHSVFEQVDAEAVHAQYDKLLDHVRALPEVHDHLDTAREEILAFTAFPPAVWRQIWSEQPQRTAQPRDPPTHRRRRDLPGPQLDHPSRWSGPGRAERRMGRRPPLPRPRDPRQEPPRPDHHREDPGGSPDTRRHQRLTNNEDSQDVVHHVTGLDLVSPR